MSKPANPSPYIAPRLILRVGVTGHRPNNLGGADLDLLECQAQRVLTCLKAVALEVHGVSLRSQGGGPYATEEPELRLATALAEGADRLVARAAMGAGYGLHLILPFPTDVYEQDFQGQALDEFHQICNEAAVRSRTELHVSSTPHDPAAYRAAGLLTLSHSDVLIAVWNGQPAAGVGGTAEIVLEAHRRGMIVVLITLAGEVCLLKEQEQVMDPMLEEAWIALEVGGQEPACSNALAERLRKLLSFPEELQADSKGNGRDHRPEKKGAYGRLQDFRAEHLHKHTYFFGYDLLRKLAMPQRKFSVRINHDLDGKRSREWKKTREAAAKIGGEALQRTIDDRLRERWLGADNLAIHYAQRFRTAYVLIFTLAALAVIVGLLALFFPESTGVKAQLVMIELVLIGTVLLVFGVGDRKRWHERWLEYRSLAETLRPARLAALIGSSPVATVPTFGGSHGERWVAWYVRAALRELAPPTAVLGRPALTLAGQVALEEEVAEQLDYHKNNAKTVARLDHRLERAAGAALLVTIATGLLFLAVFFWDPCPAGPGLAKGMKPVVTFLGGALPMVGAAIFGIRATADFRSVRQQSEHMVEELGRIMDLLKARALQPDRDGTVQVFGRLSRSLSDDVKLWGMVYSSRELSL